MVTHSAVVLAAGKGTRMKSKTPKVLHRICGKPMVSHVLDTTDQAGLFPIVVVIPSESQDIGDFLGEGVTCVEQREQLGTGHALLQAEASLRDVDNVVVLAGDVPLISSKTLKKMLRLHDEHEACVTLVTSTLTNPDGLGRIVRSDSGRITNIVEEIEADESILSIAEINGGIYCFRVPWLWDNLKTLTPDNKKGEIFLTDLIALASRQGLTIESLEASDPFETIGVNNRVQLAEAEGELRRRIREKWMLDGVTMPDPGSVFIDIGVELGQDTVIFPNTHIRGNSRIGSDCEIGPNSIVENSNIANNCKVLASTIEEATLDEGVDVGPYSRVRHGAHLEKNVHIGNFAEVKNSRLGPGTKSGHFSYIGDAQVGSNVNIGAGTVTCNYDGEIKNVTTIGDDVFVGSGTMLIAPIELGDRAATGAGAVVTKDVPPDTRVAGVPARPLEGKKNSVGNTNQTG